MSALDTQVAGEHYKKYKIQPMEYSMANGLDACQHTAIKYITRFRDKGGIEDLEKAKHCIDMLIEFERKALCDMVAGTLAEDLEKGSAWPSPITIPECVRPPIKPLSCSFTGCINPPYADSDKCTYHQFDGH